MIAYVLPFPGIGGTELQTLRLAEAGRSLGLASTAYCPADAPVVAELFRDHGFNVESYNQVQPSFHAPLPFVRESRRIAGVMRGRGTRVVHCGDILGAHFLGFAGRLAAARVLSHVRNSYRNLTRREGFFLWPVQEFIYVSNATREALNLRDARKRKGRVLYDLPATTLTAPHIRTEARDRFGIQATQRVIGVAARMARQKDWPTLIRAASIVARSIPDVIFLIAADLASSDPGYLKQVEDLLDSTATRAYFHFAGFQTDMSWFYTAIDCFALSSHTEGLATVLLEAMTYHKPVVATDVDGNREAVIDETTGLLARHESPEHFARQLTRLLTEPDLARRLEQNASVHLEKTFGHERFIRQVAGLYASAGLIRQITSSPITLPNGAPQ